MKTLQDIDAAALFSLYHAIGLGTSWHGDGELLPGSHWGDAEAGLIGSVIHVRADTPVHSYLHEAGHWALMDSERRARLHTDAGGTAVEENAVCYLQILMADRVDSYGRSEMLSDMDAWGYSFRLGSAARWFAEDADDAIEFLRRHRDRWRGLDADGELLRQLPLGTR